MQGLGANSSMWLDRGFDLLGSYLGRKTTTNTAQINAQRDVAIEKARTKKFLYFGVGLVGVALFIKITKIMRK